jgi:hypothetical protein
MTIIDRLVVKTLGSTFFLYLHGRCVIYPEDFRFIYIVNVGKPVGLQ